MPSAHLIPSLSLRVLKLPTAALTQLPRSSAFLRGGAATPFLTDNGNLVLDVTFEAIPDPAALAARLKAVAGVIEHGLFVGLARSAIVGGPDGVQVLGQALDTAPGPGGGR